MRLCYSAGSQYSGHCLFSKSTKPDARRAKSNAWGVLKMITETLLPFDYDDLRTCPYCRSTNLMNAASDRYLILEQCPHFVAAFESGTWARDICPPVACNGFLFDQNKLEEAVAQIDDAVMKVKPATRWHPRITAIYCRRPGTAGDSLARLVAYPI